MAGKKREIQLQTVINTQSLWDEMLQNKGLTVIDVYQAWCGPCKAMQTLFRKLKNELNEDEFLHFVVAEADSIVTLLPFRDNCEPIFLFSVNGKIITKIEGANAPLVNQTIINLVEEERKIAAGEMVRPQYNEIALIDSDAEDAEEASKGNLDALRYVVIIKPEAVSTRRVSEIKENIINGGFVIEEEENRILTEQQVRDFYSKIEDQPDFEDFVSFMINSLSCVLVVSRIPEPEPPSEEILSDSETEPKEPPEDQPETDTPTVVRKWSSLQEYLERQDIYQFCDIENNTNEVHKFIDIFFPDFRGVKVEKILALLRPDLFREKKEEVLNIIQNEGFTILAQRDIVLSEEEARTLCKEYENKDYFENVIENMTSGPSLALILVRENGLQHWKELIGPSTVEEAKEHLAEGSDSNHGLCIQFATESLPINQLYGSDSIEAAKREIEDFFPPENTLALIKPHVTQEQKEVIFDMIKNSGFEIIQMKKILLIKEESDKVYFKIVNRDFYKDVLEVLAEGPSLVLMLHKWNAVLDWRRLMGPTDPNEAKLLSPDSIRARFGISILRNAVHGSSNILEATETLQMLFGDFPSSES